MEKKKRIIAGILVALLLINSGINGSFATGEIGSTEDTSVTEAVTGTEEIESTEQEATEITEATEATEATEISEPESEAEPETPATVDGSDTSSETKTKARAKTKSAAKSTGTSIYEEIFDVTLSQFQADKTNYAEVYIGNYTGGEDTADQGSKEKPYTNLNTAYKELESKGVKGAIIHLTDTVSVSTWPDQKIPAVIVSDSYDTALLSMISTSWEFHANTGFCNVQIQMAYDTETESATPTMFANGNTLVFGEQGQNNFAITTEGSQSYPTLFGAGASSNGTVSKHDQSISSTCLKVYAGTWSQIFGGGEFYSDVTGTATIVVDGYIEKDEKAGAVSFVTSDNPYMEGSSNVYGGGAGEYKNIGASYYSSVAGTSVTVRYLTTQKSVTPCGGVVTETADITVDHCTIGNCVNARSEGASAPTVTLNISDSTVKGSVGSLGYIHIGGVEVDSATHTYMLDTTIQTLNISIQNSKVSNYVSLRGGYIAKGYSSGDNKVISADLKIKDSTVNKLYLYDTYCGSAYSGTLSLELENVSYTSFACNGNVAAFQKLVLKKMGTDTKPFLFSSTTFMGVYNDAAIHPQNAEITDSYVSFTTDYIIDDLNLKNSRVNLASQTTLTVKNSYTNSSVENTTPENKMILGDNSLFEINGSASGTAATVQANLTKEASDALITWYRNSGIAANPGLFKNGEQNDGIYFHSASTAHMNSWKWSNEDTTDQNYVYLDGEYGHDEASDYEDEACTAGNLGLDISYPVKTFQKAYALAKEKGITTIVLCGYYPLQYAADASSLDLVTAQPVTETTDPIIITSVDDSGDYRKNAGFVFSGTGGSLNLNASFTFEKVKLTSSSTKTFRIFGNGYPTTFASSVTVDAKALEVYGGGNNTSVASTDLTINCSGFQAFAASGYGDSSWVGDASGDPNEVVAKISVANQTTKDSALVFCGNTYGSVTNTISGYLRKIFLDSSTVTVAGNFSTTLSGTCSVRFPSQEAYICPSGMTVKGELNYYHNSKTYYDSISLGSGHYSTINITLDVPQIEGTTSISNLSLVDKATEAKTINWTVTAPEIKAISGKPDNPYLKAGTESLTLRLTDGSFSSVSACGSSGTYDAYPNVSVIFENINERTLSDLTGFGTVICEGGKLQINSDLATTNLNVTNGAKLILTGSTAIGGNLSILDGSTLEVQNAIHINGSMKGETAGNTPGTLFNNWAEVGSAQQIVVDGTVSGTTYYATDYEEAEIKVAGNSEGSEYQTYDPMEISCTPEAGTYQGRVWKVKNPINKKYVYVDGTLDPTDPTYATHNGSTPELAFASMYEAYDQVLKNGYIVICGNTKISAWPQNATKNVTITGMLSTDKGDPVDYDWFSDGTVKLTIATNIELLADTTFEYLNLTPNNYMLAARGHKLVMGHEGTASSLKMINSSLSIAGGSTIKECYDIVADVTIYDGTYSNAYGGDSVGSGLHSTFASVSLKIYGGSFSTITIQNNRHEKFPETVNFCIQDAAVTKYVSVLNVNCGLAKSYNINIGKNMNFGKDCVIYLGASDGIYGYSTTFNLTVDGTGGTAYNIPVITCGNRGTRSGKTTANISIKNATADNLYLGSYNQSGSTDTIGNLTLLDEASVQNLYFGGYQYADTSATVTIKSDTARITNLSSGSYSDPTLIPATAKLIFEGVGTKDSPYTLSSGVSLDGLTEVDLNNSVVDITDTGNAASIGTLKLSNSSALKYIGTAYTLTGNYEGGTAEAPATWYGSYAPVITINGTVSGTTQLLSVDSSDGKFESGITVTAKMDPAHTKDNFLTKNLDQGLVAMNFTSGLDTNAATDVWMKLTEENTSSQVDLYVYSKGSDSYSGSVAMPVRTLRQAYLNAQKIFAADNTKKNLKIYLRDDTAFTGSFDTEFSEGYTVTITSQNPANPASLVLSGSNDSFAFPVDTILDQVNIKSTLSGKSAEIYANGHTLTVSEDVNTTAVSNYYPKLYAGTAASTDLDKTDLTVYGGTWNQIFGGSKTSSVGTVNLLVGKNVNTRAIGGTQEESETGVFGGGESGTVGTVNLTVCGGEYYRILGGGMNTSADVTSSITVNFTHGTTERLYGGGQRGTCDGDIVVTIGRKDAKEDTPKAVITSMFRGSGLYAELASGKKATTYVYDNAVVNPDKNADSEFFAGGYSGTVEQTFLYIRGGTINSDVYGGGYGQGTEGIYGKVNDSTVEISGGTISGHVYGGGKLALVNDKASVKVTGGKIKGNIYGGGNAAGVKGSTVEIGMGDLTSTDSVSINGNVFGGSFNIDPDNTVLQIQETANVSLGNANIEGSVFGGSDTSGLIGKIDESGNLTGSVKVTVNGTATVTGGVFGGGSKAALEIQPEVTVASTASLTGDIYGGGMGEIVSSAEGGTTTAEISLLSEMNTALTTALSGEKTYNTTGLTDANVPSTNVEIGGKVTGNVYGGGKLATVGSTNNTTWNNTVTQVTVTSNAAINGNVYGGGEGGKEHPDYAVVYGNTSVVLNECTIQATDSDGKVTDSETAENGAVFGGGKIAPVAGNTAVTANAGTISNIFGGNDASGSIEGSTNVTLPADSAASVEHLFGGGRQAAYENDNSTKVLISAGKVTEAYAGGYGTTAVTKNGSIEITGGTVTTAFAGGKKATVTGSTTLTVNTTDKKDDGSLVQHVTTVYAGNNNAAMAIQPKLVLTSGKIGTVYGGGNQGIMTRSGGLTYDFDYPNIVVDTVYAGCNNTTEKTANVNLNLISGTYGTVYGGNNANGYMEQTNVTITQGTDKTLSVGTVYGGGNKAAGNNTKVTLSAYSGNGLTIYGGGNQAAVTGAAIYLDGGSADTVYGGGNHASVTKTVQISSAAEGKAEVTNLFCGNNLAEMSIQPDISGLQAITVTNFYGGGNAGNMITETMNAGKADAGVLTYTFDKATTKIGTIYGGCYAADVKGSVTLNIAGATINTVYGGCNESGTVTTKAAVNVLGDVGTEAKNGKIFGGGYGNKTKVTATEVNVQNGTVYGNVYGGSNKGSVENAKVLLQEEPNNTDAKIVVTGDVYGAGYGESSVAMNTDVTVNMALKIDLAEYVDGNFLLKANMIDNETTDSVSSGETVAELTEKNITNLSYVAGSVFGGGDMGMVGTGKINSNNTADITAAGQTQVTILNGWIKTNVFGGGNGAPPADSDILYTLYMGTVFGKSTTNVKGGYIAGSVFGCGNQSRTYAGSDGQAAELTIAEQQNTDVTPEVQGNPIVIGTSIFGGANKGEGNTVNASVYTVIGNTDVTITGLKSADNPTAIYLLSANEGGVYGDGRLCLVNGERTVTIENFNRGKKYFNNQLKTFYSLQRADKVTLINTRIVLEGAKDLVSATGDTTTYSINRVEQLELKKNSAIKLKTVVNLLGGLSSDCNTSRKYIDKGSNSGEEMLKNDEITKYQTNYKLFEDAKGVENSSEDESFNVVCVANGQYLEIKQSEKQYGNVSGLFILQLLHANPGEGGGFVYANIGDATGTKAVDVGSTGDFVCVTKKGSSENSAYMDIQDGKGGYDVDGFTYYYWYIEGGNYNYDVKLNGYIGVSQTEFSESVMLPTIPLETNKTKNQYQYKLSSITGAAVSFSDDGTHFNSTRLQSSWDEEDKDKDVYAIELKMSAVLQDADNKRSTEEKSIGYLKWVEGTNGAAGSWVIYGNAQTANSGETTSSSARDLTEDDVIYTVPAGTNIQSLNLKLVLHKGTGVDVEIWNVPNTITLIREGDDPTADSEVSPTMTIRSYTSITRIVPSQDVYTGSGRLYSGVPQNSTVNITDNSAFSVQYITSYVPSAFSGDVTETLSLKYKERYLIDASGTGFTFTGNTTDNRTSWTLTAVTKGNLSDYAGADFDPTTNILTYDKTIGDITTQEKLLLTSSADYDNDLVLPKGTTITLVAQIDDYDFTYWYYYCEDETGVSEINLDQFVSMGSAKEGENRTTYSLSNASGEQVTQKTQTRITEKLTFIINFEQIGTLSGDFTGKLKLAHTYRSTSGEQQDIMDFVEENVNDSSKSQRRYPVLSSQVTVTPTDTTSCELTLDTTSAFNRGTMNVAYKITPDGAHENTLYSERGYAVKLELYNDDAPIAFPAGTEFTYGKNTLYPDKTNSYVIIPAGDATSGTFTINTGLLGWASLKNSLNLKDEDALDLKLRATLYSSSASGYYDTDAAGYKFTNKAEFTVNNDPTSWLLTTADNRVVTTGQKLNVTVTAGTDAADSTSSTGSTSSAKVTVQLYSFVPDSGSYSLIKDASKVLSLDGATSSTTEAGTTELAITVSSGSTTWTPTIADKAASGTYRLEFTYDDKTDYLDFIVQ